MRISGSGSGNAGFGGGEDRSSAFRRGHRPGQKVRGRVLQRVAADMAWVEIDGHRLLARLRADYPAGTWLIFLIQQLTPEIVLKELGGGSSPTVPRLETAASFETARTLFENRFRPHAASLAREPAPARPGAFLALLEADDRLLAAYLDALACARDITRLFPAPGCRLLYQPWLMPEARRQATIIHVPPNDGQAMTGAVAEFELAPWGLVRAEFLHKDRETGYRLKLQRVEARDALQRRLEDRIRTDFGDVRCLGITKLARREHGGIVAERLFTE